MLARRLRKLIGTAGALILVGLSSPATAVIYDLGFDPFDFNGIMTIDVPTSCFTPASSDNSCPFDVLNGSFTDSLNRVWDIPNDPGIGDQVRISAADTLTGISVDITNLVPSDFDSNCDGSDLNFSLDGTVTFNCGGVTTDTGHVTSITRVPEPGTLALMGLAFAVLAAMLRWRSVHPTRLGLPRVVGGVLASLRAAYAALNRAFPRPTRNPGHT